MQLIATLTMGTPTGGGLEFLNIPQTFTDLLIVGSARSTAATVSENLNIYFNGSAAGTAYSARRLYGTGSATASDSFSSLGYMPGVWMTGANATANTFGNFQIYIPNYAAAVNKTISVDSVGETNATAVNQGITAGLFASTAAITSVALSVAMAQGSTASLYGITKGSGGATVA